VTWVSQAAFSQIHSGEIKAKGRVEGFERLAA
jgi:hypothetical protein